MNLSSWISTVAELGAETPIIEIGDVETEDAVPGEVIISRWVLVKTITSTTGASVDHVGDAMPGEPENRIVWIS